MTTLEKATKAILVRVPFGYGMTGKEADEYARAAIESLRTPGIEHTDRIFNVMLDRILKEEV